MASLSKKQYDFFRTVKGYKEGGMEGLVKAWRRIFGDRPLNEESVRKIIKASSISDEDLKEMLRPFSEEAETKEATIKVGNWILFKGKFKASSGEVIEREFIAQISRINNSLKIVNFSPENLYSKTGNKVGALKRANITNPNFPYMDFTFFDKIITVAQTKNELVHSNMNESLRKMISETIKEVIMENLLKIEDNQGDILKIGSMVRMIKDDGRRGIIKQLAIDFKDDNGTQKDKGNLVVVSWHFIPKGIDSEEKEKISPKKLIKVK
jgi:hypothetical protein